MTHTLRALALGLAFALTFTACDSGTDTPDGDDVAATGTLDNNFGAPVEGATMTFTSGAANRGSASMPTYTTTSGANGAFNLNIPPGTYTLTVTHPNYGTTTTTVTVSASGQVTIQTPVTGPGIFETLIVNALNGQGIPNASIACYTGTTTTGEAAFTATSDANGNVSVTGTPYGALQCTAVTPFGPQAFGITIAATGTTTAPPVAVVPLPSAGEYRVVLTWGTSPRDLDSHVTGPDGSGGRFHVYYANSSFGSTNLDLDDTSGEGPETITVNAAAGVAGQPYRYSVFNYSDQSPSGAQGIAESPAFVNVYGPQGLLRRYKAPPTTLGNTWRVFELTIQGTAVNYNDNCSLPIGPYPAGTPDSQIPVCRGLGYFQATSSGDTGTFLTGGPGEAPMPKGIAL